MVISLNNEVDARMLLSQLLKEALNGQTSWETSKIPNIREHLELKYLGED